MTAALRAEWIKATTLWSIRLSLLAFAVVTAGISVAVAATVGAAEAARPDYDAAVIAFYGLNFGHVAVLVVAVLLTAGEYGARTIGTSLTAVPRRGVFLAAKVAVGAGLVLAVATVTAVVTFAATQAVLGPDAVGPGTPGVLRSIAAAALFPALLAVVCMGIGMLARDAAGALTALVPFFFLVSPLLELVPGLQRAAVFLPDRAGAVAVRLHERPVDAFGPVTGLLVMAGWAAAAVLAAWWALHRRDA
ncbi:hypothetical protein [Blastococcus sp. SYSU D00820]